MTIAISKIVFLLILGIISLFKNYIAPTLSEWPSFILCMIAIVFLW